MFNAELVVFFTETHSRNKKAIMERRGFLRLSACLLGGFATLEGFAVSNTYRIVRGDTLSGIAQKFDTTVSKLKQLNQLSSDKILSGQTLKVRETVTSSLESSVVAEIAKAPINRSKWKHVIVHHSATTQGSAKSFHQAHLRRGMANGLAYHFVIGNGRGSADGEIEVGHRWRGQLNGGHVKNEWFNGNSVGICLVGNFEKSKPTTRQMQSLHHLLGHLKGGGLFNRQLRLFAHKELPREQTLCPGRHLDLKALHRTYGRLPS
jgi:LysM repeat protein